MWRVVRVELLGGHSSNRSGEACPFRPYSYPGSRGFASSRFLAHARGGAERAPDGWWSTATSAAPPLRAMGSSWLAAPSSIRREGSQASVHSPISTAAERRHYSWRSSSQTGVGAETVSVLKVHLPPGSAGRKRDGGRDRQCSTAPPWAPPGAFAPRSWGSRSPVRITESPGEKGSRGFASSRFL
jgi:hypothetical protein